MIKKTSIKIDLERLSGPVQTHNPQIKIEEMHDTHLPINFQFVKTDLGNALIASTKKGVCYFGFVVGEKKASYQDFTSRFPGAIFTEQSDTLQKEVLAHLSQRKSSRIISFHIAGTSFQQKTWNALLHIPPGKFATYGSIAKFIKHPNAYRAVGTAVGMNPISVLIPCHRVVQTNGALGSYHWGTDLKERIIKSENIS